MNMFTGLLVLGFCAVASAAVIAPLGTKLSITRDPFGNLIETPVFPDTVLRGKRALIETDTIETDVFGNVVEQKVIEETNPIPRGKRAIVVDPLLQQNLLDEPLIVDPLLRGKRALVESDTIESDAFGNVVEQRVVEETDPLLRGKRALLVLDPILQSKLLAQPVFADQLIVETAPLLRAKRAVVESDTIAEDAFGNVVEQRTLEETSPLLRAKRATIIQDSILSLDPFGQIVEQPILLIV